ncbi:immune inhibitor A [Kineosporia rhizophila]|uniref:immune inhibitor A domain-containing protein n=1 Tax=Kineosporia rhizophila TaxID=84633 RepID=UPI001E58CBC4|nr:immune inhibitor A domain-containing protein [Kineosporia rhizophila]MCE0535332.1 immune inhibitor A [Kineosporia rhizophila]
MVRKRLAAPVALALAVPLAALVPSAAPSSAAPEPERAGIASDITMGVRDPQLVEGEKVEVPDRPRTQRKARSKAQAGTTPGVGTVRQWLALDDKNGVYYRKDYTLRGVGDHIEVWVANDIAFPQGDCRNAVPGSTTVTDAQVAGLITQFDTNMYPKETAAFSTPPDRDGSNALLGPDANGNGGEYGGGGGKTVTLVDNVRDENFFDFPAVPTYTAGFFSASLNELFDRNVMTIDAFDWAHRTTANPADAATSDLCTSRPARPWLYEGVFAHEWQHLLQYYTDLSESTWVNEGLSDFAISLVGYSNTTATVFEPGFDNHLISYQGYSTVETPYNRNPRDSGGAQNSLTLWGEDSDNPNAVLADYGHAYAFLLFLYDRYGQDFISGLHRDGEHQGLAGVAAQLKNEGVKQDVYDVLHDFQSSNVLDAFLDSSKKSKLTGADKSAVTSKSLNSSINLANPQSYLDPGAAPNGADYVPVMKDGKPIRGKDIDTLTFAGAKTLPPLSLAWTVVSNDPDRPGNPVLFSGNQNNTDAALVTEASVPTTDPKLRFLAKYGAEAGYDYAYVSVSTDGGKTYSTPLPGDKTVDGPFGPALNGTTSGFEAHEYDLSAYAGQEILVSIRYVSDAGVNEGGLLIDDLTVGSTKLSDGSSLEPFDSPTEIAPVAVANWNVRLIGLDARKERAAQITFDGQSGIDLGRRSPEVRELRKAEQVVAVVAYDEPTEQGQQYAPYKLTVNGVVQPGGGQS